MKGLPVCSAPLPMRFTGTVRRGKQLGRTLGFPTANLILNEGETVPEYGVYVCTVAFDGKEFPAVTNVGRHPTLPDGPKTIEPHILADGKFDLYGKEITVTLTAFLRPEQRFSSREALVAAVEENKRQALEWFEEQRK